jgi:hypothetical protein
MHIEFIFYLLACYTSYFYIIVLIPYCVGNDYVVMHFISFQLHFTLNLKIHTSCYSYCRLLLRFLL